ncbi:MAG: hypothetical protein R6X02_12370 [Enhygromyxa sp.]
MAGLCAALVLATTLAPPPDPAPGGYWSVGEQRQRRGEPPDGDDELTVGSVLFSLGLLRIGAAAVNVWMARTPQKCPIKDPGGCRSFEIYGWFGVGEGGLMFGTGLTYLIIGAVRDRRHRRWQAGESVARPRAWGAARRLELGPWLVWRPEDRPGLLRADPVGGGAQFRWRF